MGLIQACWMAHYAVTGKPPQMWQVIAEAVAVAAIVATALMAFASWMFG